MKRVFIVTGEYSGDIHGSNVAKRLFELHPDIEIEGVGGDNMKSAGVKLLSDHKKMGAVGLSPAIIFSHYLLGKKIVEHLTGEFKPDAVILIDYGAFNLSLAKVLKKFNIKIFYYIPPQVWASRKWRIHTIKKYIDEVLCIFPFEKKMYEEFGIKTHYCGHPLISQLPEKANRDEFFEKYNLDKNKKLVAIFPGSRTFELKQLMKVFIKSAQKLEKQHSDIQFVISHAPNLSDKVFDKYLRNTDYKVIKGDNQALLSVSDGLILASGTVALEAAIYETPMIIAYRGPWLFYLIYLLVRCIKMVSLPNIIAGEIIVPEIIQGKVNTENISYEIEKILYDNNYRQNYIEKLSHVKSLLSDKNSSKEAANEVFSVLNNVK